MEKDYNLYNSTALEYAHLFEKSDNRHNSKQWDQLRWNEMLIILFIGSWIIF